MVKGGRLEKEQMIEEKILGNRMLPNSRLYEIKFLSFLENEQQLEH